MSKKPGAVHHEPRDVRLREPGESIPESQLRPDAPFRAVVDVPGDNDERNGVFQRCVDEVVERQCRSISEGGDEAGIDTAHPRERRVHVEVGGVEEPEAHRTCSRVERPRLPCDPGRSNVADLSLQRSLVSLGLSLEPLDHPVVKIVDCQTTHTFSPFTAYASSLYYHNASVWVSARLVMNTCF